MREQQLVLAERFDNGASRTQTAEGFKQESDTLLHLLVGVEHHLTLCVVKKADRKRRPQFAVISSASLIVPFKPAAALCGCTVTIAFEDSPYCGQSGRVRRVFWRERTPWVLVRLRVGGIVSVPWDETDLPVTKLEGGPSPDDGPTVLLSSDALRDLVRFLRDHGNKPK